MNGCLNVICLHGFFLVLDAHVDELLRIARNGARELGKLFALGIEHFHHTQARHDAVARFFEIGENHMTRLLATKRIAALHHRCPDIFVADIGLHITNARIIKRLEETEIAHNGRNDGIAREASVFCEVGTTNVKDKVPVNYMAALIHR